MKKMKRVSIVILNWNGARMLRRFLPSVLDNSDGAEVVVADNASKDNSLEMVKSLYPSVRTISMDRNYGFAEGYNKALELVDSEYYILLNSDVEVGEGWLSPMLAYMDSHPEVAACQPKILQYGGAGRFEYAGACGGYIDWLGYPFCRGRMLDTVEQDEGQYDDVAQVTWASGAALMIRREVYWLAGGLDGKFFAHQEEIDLCWRIRSMGYGIVCVPDSKVYHVGGGTLPKSSSIKTYLNFRNNLYMLCKNLPDGRLAMVMMCRLLLDALASVHFVIKGDWECFKAIWKAHRDYHRFKELMSEDRKRNLDRTKVPLDGILTHKSLLWQYYVRGRKTYREWFGSYTATDTRESAQP